MSERPHKCDDSGVGWLVGILLGLIIAALACLCIPKLIELQALALAVPK